MPVSHSHKILFIHIPKTAGSSIEKVFGIFGRNNRGSLRADHSILYGICKSNLILHHLSIQELLTHQLVNADVMNYFKFSVVRNPWDRMVSEYFWRKKYRLLPQNCSFQKFILQLDVLRSDRDRHSNHLLPQLSYLSNSENAILVDYIARYENLSSDFLEICKKSRSQIVDLPRINQANETKCYRQYYNRRTREVIEEQYANDIQTFNYEF